MTTEEKEVLARAKELSQRAYQRGIYTRTNFLTESEAALIAEEKPDLGAVFLGGSPEAERCIALFGKEEEMGYPWESDLVILKISPLSQKFADTLFHRDFLGALLNLGIKRDLLGDLFVFENTGFFVSFEQMAPYFMENLTRVKHTSVKVTLCDALPEGVGAKFEEKFVVAASPRMDAVISAVWNLSRQEGKKLVEGERVSIRGKTVLSPERSLSAGDRVSVKGYGRFYFDGEEGMTRSGRGRMKVRLFV